MAVIKNNKTGMWEVRTYYKDLTGERKQKTKRGFAKKSEALEWERKLYCERHCGRKGIAIVKTAKIFQANQILR